MKILFTFFILVTAQHLNAQHFKNNEFSLGVAKLFPLQDLKKFNFSGIGAELSFSKKIKNASLYFVNSLQVNQFAGTKIYYLSPNGGEAPTLQSASLFYISTGVAKHFKNLVATFKIGAGYCNKSTSDQKQFLFLMTEPTISYRVTKWLEPTVSIHYGRTKENDFLFLQTGVKFIF